MLTAVVLTHNEEGTLLRCLNSLKFCDQTIVIDDQSTDNSVKIATTAGAKVFHHPLNGNFSVQRNYALSQIKSGWALFIDSDEEVSPSLSQEIIFTVKKTDHHAYYLRRIDTLWGKKLFYGDTNTRILRLGLVNSGKWIGRVHERWNITGSTGVLKAVLDHYPHPKFTQFISDLNYYSTLRAEELFQQDIRTNIVSVILYPIGKFTLIYLIKLGFLDGMPGLMSAMSMSFYSFLVRGKLYLLKKGVPVSHV